MATLKCKMCGGELELNEIAGICTCEYCGTTQTIPKLDNDRKINLYDRAGHFRRNNDYDKAMGIYEQLLNEDDTDAEAYWSLVLCRYGIEYVEDPATHKRMPTINRAQYTSVFADADYLAALEHAAPDQRAVYEAEAKTIDEIQKGILKISQREAPFDVFICYKETDANGRRTQDSVLANDLYHQLTQEGFKVFFSRITLEDKLGTAYEPYIFAALNSAKVMVALGTKPEYFNAVWVKNEWSRYLALIRGGAKKMLIPAYRDMDPYDLPDAFSHLQAQDMSKLGFMQDLIRGIKKILGADEPKAEPAKETVVVQQTPTGTTSEAAQVERGMMALEDGEWDKADGFFEEALNLNPKSAEAYLGKLLAKTKVANLTSFVSYYRWKTISAGSATLTACSEDTARLEHAKKQYTIPDYNEASAFMPAYVYDRTYSSELSARNKQKSNTLAELDADKTLARVKSFAAGETKTAVDKALAEITKLLDDRIASAQAADEKKIEAIKQAYAAHLDQCDAKAAEKMQSAAERREADYTAAVEMMQKADTIFAYAAAENSFENLKGYSDSKKHIQTCEKEIARLKDEAASKQAAKDKKQQIGIVLAVSVVAICIALALVTTKVIIPSAKYNKAVALFGEDAWNQIQNGIYTFGTYGSEDIEWLVLERDGANLFLLSKYALDAKPYNEEATDVTWETCSLRDWLNNEFFTTAFSAEEQSIIKTTTVTADSNPKYSTSPGNDTEDKIFLLSITEAEKYFDSDEARKCVPTAYALTNGARSSFRDTLGGKATCWWWLRSPGSNSSFAAGVNYDGWVYASGDRVSNDVHCIRPALWVNLAS